MTALTWIYNDESKGNGVCIVTYKESTDRYTETYTYNIDGVAAEFTCFLNYEPKLKPLFAIFYRTDETTFGETLLNGRSFVKVQTVPTHNGEFEHRLRVINGSLPVFSIEYPFSSQEMFFYVE